MKFVYVYKAYNLETGRQIETKEYSSFSLAIKHFLLCLSMTTQEDFIQAPSFLKFADLRVQGGKTLEVASGGRKLILTSVQR